MRYSIKKQVAGEKISEACKFNLIMHVKMCTSSNESLIGRNQIPAWCIKLPTDRLETTVNLKHRI